MNSLARACFVVCVVSSITLSETASAQTAPPGAGFAVRELSEAETIGLVLHHNPDLEGARLSEKQAGFAVRAEEARYPLVLTANAGYTHSASPALGPNGTVVTGSRDSVVIGSALSKNFATGTSLSLSLQGERNSTNRSVGSNITSGAAGTGYSLSTRFTVAQPILRGAGTLIGESTLRSAKLDLAAEREGLGRVTSEVVRDSLTAYWELWYASQSLRIEEAARALASAERADADARRALGTLSPVDVLAYDTRVASLGEQVTAAELSELDRGLALAQLLGIDASAARLRATGSPAEQKTPSITEVEKKLSEKSPELLELMARVEAAEARAKVAGDAYRPRLDLQGYVELRGLGNGSVGPALVQVGTFGAASGYVGLNFEAPLTGAREQTEIEAARVNANLARNQLEAAKSRIRILATRLVAQIDAAKARRTSAEQTEAIATRQFEAEQARFKLGASTPIQVQQAEDAVRSARLRVARARVDEVQLALALEHAVGDLAARYGVTSGR